MFLTKEQRIERMARKTVELIAAATITGTTIFIILGALLFL